ncbi:Protein of unknown function (DUF3152) [Goodfellowiella coeruleoviolacea]|uniref:DUF3152 domain-containing protein n=1 Tax=Goodfellowiella coeruleoviolacea TaxID=334858 RepID=A0AAE3GIG6_9PSEU|nr:Protein of unknown function (DUF3152) [Goodfellowiella coeruleoviolacea]
MRRGSSAEDSGTSRRPATARGGPDRYRRGARRTSAEPLAASWRPLEDQERDTGSGRRPAGQAKRDKEERRRRGIGALLAHYGWRVYAVPVLVALTALVVMDTTGTSSDPGSGTLGGSIASGDQPATSGPPLGAEIPATPVGPDIPTAELPDGFDFTQKGNSTWRVIPGTKAKYGTGGPVKKYTIEVEDGINPGEYGGDDALALLIDQTLSDPARGWTASGDVSLERVDPNVERPDFRVSLTTPETTKRPDLCGFNIKYPASCNSRETGRVIINLARWVRGAKAFNGDMDTYRRYAINHEVGHALNHYHEACKKDGDLAPVMMQQTFGVANDYVYLLNQVDPSNSGAVPNDGKTCRVNAWPVPQGQN